MPYKQGAPRRSNTYKSTPTERGEYRIVENATKNVKYIGVSSNLKRRHYQHTKSGLFVEGADHLRYLLAGSGADDEDIYSHEKRSISKHKPQHNRCAGGNGRRTK